MIRHALIFWITTALAVWGLVVDLMVRGIAALSFFIFPLVLLALLYYAYKVAPGRMGGGPGRPRTKIKPSAKTMSKVAGIRKTQGVPSKRKSYPFQVIEGSKGKNDDQLPKYH
ncbi:hypothetical protein HQN87_06610 [Paenibacillus tritici]|jgi:hypothetical protein|uniref:DUF2207 domain-containing protein n=1 Tax=Paenibacillus tritici TaxID=1873425 RepID=A0ABX2DK48_9BACL|nr:hypothetical protein [Paenibacillus tritici]NQX44996.1 hypothetical protein [Paenibacillus tritici]QUL53046.1 hypothetical protein KDC22_21790 [Paenibacillus tritici]